MGEGHAARLDCINGKDNFWCQMHRRVFCSCVFILSFPVALVNFSGFSFWGVSSCFSGAGIFPG